MTRLTDREARKVATTLDEIDRRVVASKHKTKQRRPIRLLPVVVRQVPQGTEAA